MQIYTANALIQKLSTRNLASINARKLEETSKAAYSTSLKNKLLRATNLLLNITSQEKLTINLGPIK